MMSRIPTRLNTIAAAFDEAARAASLTLVRLCESSGSDHSPDELGDLSDLVNSFIESDCAFETDDRHESMKKKENDHEKDDIGSDSEAYWCETKDTLKSFVVNNEEDNYEKLKILQKTAEFAGRNISDMSSEDFKRRLMSDLRHNGFDAGLCKSRWEKFGRHPAGRYEYIDVNVSDTRYIIEVNLAREFEIARPTTSYTSLIQVFPRIFVGKPEELKQIVRLMCKAMRESMKSKDLKMPPWRRNGYMHAKWSSHYKRTTSDGVSAKEALKKSNVAAVSKRLVGFEELPTNISYYCRDNLVADKACPKISYLTAAFGSKG